MPPHPPTPPAALQPDDVPNFTPIFIAGVPRSRSPDHFTRQECFLYSQLTTLDNTLETQPLLLLPPPPPKRGAARTETPWEVAEGGEGPKTGGLTAQRSIKMA